MSPSSLLPLQYPSRSMVVYKNPIDLRVITTFFWIDSIFFRVNPLAVLPSMQRSLKKNLTLHVHPRHNAMNLIGRQLVELHK